MNTCSKKKLVKFYMECCGPHTMGKNKRNRGGSEAGA